VDPLLVAAERIVCTPHKHRPVDNSLHTFCKLLAGPCTYSDARYDCFFPWAWGGMCSVLKRHCTSNFTYLVHSGQSTYSENQRVSHDSPRTFDYYCIWHHLFLTLPGGLLLGNPCQVLIKVICGLILRRGDALAYVAGLDVLSVLVTSRGLYIHTGFR